MAAPVEAPRHVQTAPAAEMLTGDAVVAGTRFVPPTFLSPDRPVRINQDRTRAVFPLRSGASFLFDTAQPDKSTISVPSNGEKLPSSLRRTSLVNKGENIPGSDGLKSSATVFRLTDLEVIKDRTPDGENIVTLVPPAQEGFTGIQAPFVELTTDKVNPGEKAAAWEDVYHMDEDRNGVVNEGLDPVIEAAAKNNPQLAATPV